ncbi:uncharacterized protein TA17370 [Theileria annulata]|uniref:Uncharacterized protein n=1 Tax=Theileria annulata TaxID=5874 RepID=Q4UAU0_THEAN|nr:uncharacterized protein TA17370 [Theileria annulata]CAI76061.1 hypothetical protein TA17370 [Theileria annulata]|eukprot:XP_955537.1 hypothetical protein TA17370 [Theileria annulata]
MVSHSTKGNTLINTHLTFFFLGLSSLIIYPMLDLNSFVYLRFLGITIYDAESISFFLRRLNLSIGLIFCSISMAIGHGSDCKIWSWMLFISYFLSSFYVYSLSNNYLFVGKLSLFFVVLVSLSSHGLLMSSVKLMFAKDFIFLDNKPQSRFFAFSTGCFTSGILVNILIKLTTGEIFSYSDSQNTLKMYNRLFISFTLITLICSFLTSTLKPIEMKDEDLIANGPPPLTKPTFIGNTWIFSIACFCWSLSPMLNNLTLPVMHSVKREDSFKLEFYQFLVSLIVSALFYLFDSFDVLSFKKRGYTYNSLYRSICNMMKYRPEAPLNPELKIHQDVREDISVLSNSLSVRLFRDPQAWQSLPYGFWCEWEEYDNFDTSRILNVLSMYSTITDIRNEDPFNLDEYFILGCTGLTHPQEHYKTIKRNKYILLWLVCSLVNYLNVLCCKLEEIFKHCTSPTICCLSVIMFLCCCCNQKCDFTIFICAGTCCCTSETCKEIKCYLENAIKATVEDCNALLYDINTCSLLLDSKEVDYDQMMDSLGILEELLMRFVICLLYARLIDEYLLLHKYMKCICDRLRIVCGKFRDGCTCKHAKEEKDTKPVKCSCVMYCKMVQCISKLHAKQKKVSDIFMGNNLENIIDVMPPMSLTRAIILLASFFGDFMCSDFLQEKGNCECTKDLKNCCCIGQSICFCCRFNSRVDDILTLILLAIDTPTDCDSILANVISVLASFSSFRYPSMFHHGIYYIEGIPPLAESNTSPSESNVLTVFGTIYSQFSNLMNSLLPPGHLRSSSCSFCLNEAGLCPCLRQLLCCMREVCCLIEMIINEIGTTSVSVCFIADYDKLEGYYKRLQCSAGKLKTCSTTASQCCGSTVSNGCTHSSEFCKFICCLCDSVCTTASLVCTLNQQSKISIQTLSSSLKDQLSELNEKNTNMYKSIRGTRMGMLIKPSKSLSKMITHYKKTIIGRVSDYKRWEFYLFFLSTFVCLFLIYLSRLIPYLRNIPNKTKFMYIIVLYSFITSYFFNSSFGFLSTFDKDSAFYISLAIVLGIILSILYSWLTQWFNYRMFLFEQFVDLYSRFRLLFPGSKYLNSPTLFWWIEGFVSFIKMDMLSMYNLFGISKDRDIYNPFNFGFTSKLNIEYNLVESSSHIFTEDQCLENIKSSVFDAKLLELEGLLNFRSFYHLKQTDHSFMVLSSEDNVNYPIDLLYNAWSLGSKISEFTDRLHRLREGAILAIEKDVQMQAKLNGYDIGSINKLKHFFEFQNKCLIEAPKLSLIDSSNRTHKHFLSVQSKKLIKLYQKSYSDKWKVYLQKIYSNESEEPEASTSVKETRSRRDERKLSLTDIFNKMPMESFLKSYDDWRTKKLKNCDTVFDRNDLCKVIVTKTCREFENIAFAHNDVSEIMNELIKFVLTSFTLKDTPENFEIIKLLSKKNKFAESKDVSSILDKIAKSIRSHTFGVRSSVIKDLLSICKNIDMEKTMIYKVFKYDRFLIGEWIRWQGLHISGDLVNMLRVINVLNE